MTLYLLFLVIKTSMLHNIDPLIVLSVIKVESNFNVNAVGSKGEIGLMQLNPKSFPDYSISQLQNPETNIKLGINYLKLIKESCKNKYYLNWVDCYNKGVKGSMKFGRYKETIYVKKVKKEYTNLKDYFNKRVTYE